MKKLFTLLIAFVVGLSLCACQPKTDVNDNTNDTPTNISTEDTKLSDATIKSITANALYQEILHSFSGYDSPDAGSSTYDINKIERSNGIDVYGTVTLYDKYGQLYKSDPFRKFHVSMHKDGSFPNCSIY